MSDSPENKNAHRGSSNALSSDDTSKEAFNRLFWHSRRGMLELDVLLIPFLKEAYRELPKEDQERYQQLLSCEDPDLFSWFMQKDIPDNPDLARIVKIILDRVQPD